MTDWRAVLRKAGYPAHVLVLDFETYFDDQYNMRKDSISTIEYIHDDRFEVLGLAMLDSAKPDTPRFYRGEEMVETQLGCLRHHYGSRLEGITVVAQNAKFDMAVLAYKYGIYPAYMVDTLGLARHWNSRRRNGVEHLAQYFQLPVQKGDTSQFKGWTTRSRFVTPKSRKKGPTLPVRVPTITEDEWPKLEDYAIGDVRIEWDVLTRLLPRLSLPEQELAICQHTIELFTRPVLRVDYARAADLIDQMEAEIDAAVHTYSQDRQQRSQTPVTRADISGENSFEALLEQELHWAHDDPRHYHKSAKNKKGWKFATAKEDPEREKLEQHHGSGVRLLMAAKSAMGSWPNHISRINRICNQARANGGVLPVPLKYHGAHTGRWSGDEKINLQNLGSRGHDLVNAIRELLLAPEGYTLVIADAAAIEARVLAWVAGQWDLVAKFEQNEEIYCRFAEKVLDKPVGYYRKPKGSGGIPAVEARHKWARNSVGKVGILGCGYGMGAAKAVAYSKQAVDLPTAEKLVATYRRENDAIVQFWHDIERAFLYVARHKRPVAMPRGLMLYSAPDCDVIIRLPNGRELKYHDVRIKPGQFGQPSIRVYNAMKKMWGHVWGGHLTENVVQAISRDILWLSIAAMERAHYPVAHHVHDELIACVPVEQGDAGLSCAVDALSTRPDWAQDCPLGAEGVVSERYGGH